MHLKGIILYCNSFIQQSRSIYSIFHILRGKKGIQSLHDARLFQLEIIFGIYPFLHKNLFDQNVNALVDLNLIEKKPDKDNVYIITSEGINWLDSNKENLYLKLYNGLNYNKIDQLFFERLLLLIQTYTNLKAKNMSFIPVVDNPQIVKWVKDSYNNMYSIPINKIVNNFYYEIKTLLNSFSEQEANFVVDHFSGYNFYGMNTSQLSKKYNLNLEDVYLIRTALIHQMLNMIKKDLDTFKLLSKLISNKMNNQFMMNTTLTTYTMLKKGTTPEQIAQIRNLKLNTVYDHIVEIALFDDRFSINKYINDTEKNEIFTAILNTNSYKLKDIKNAVASEISYFKIRLVLTETEKLRNKE